MLACEGNSGMAPRTNTSPRTASEGRAQPLLLKKWHGLVQELPAARMGADSNGSGTADNNRSYMAIEMGATWHGEIVGVPITAFTELCNYSVTASLTFSRAAVTSCPDN